MKLQYNIYIYQNTLLKSKLKQNTFGVHTLTTNSLVKFYTGFPNKCVLTTVLFVLKKKCKTAICNTGIGRRSTQTCKKFVFKILSIPIFEEL